MTLSCCHASTLVCAFYIPALYGNSIARAHPESSPPSVQAVELLRNGSRATRLEEGEDGAERQGRAPRRASTSFAGDFYGVVLYACYTLVSRGLYTYVSSYSLATCRVLVSVCHIYIYIHISYISACVYVPPINTEEYMRKYFNQIGMAWAFSAGIAS